MKLLARQDAVLDRILFYEDVPLFEDELHDNGESILNVRIRVMPHSFFILSRLFVRVDNVLFRIYDVRIYHAFGTAEVIREITGMEGEYADVKQILEKPSDLSPLTDANFVSQALAALKAKGIETTDRGKPWPGLGTRTEVLRLPGGVEALENLSIS
ncbi:type 2A phosphatase activator TIP41, partial [Tremellales sp. Uapishka_1]